MSVKAKKSVFRLNPKEGGRETQDQLLEFARVNPGTLATQLLQKLQDAIGKEGVQAAWTEDQRPVAALSYYHRVLVENKCTATGLLREATTLSAVLDLLALDRPREAADVVACVWWPWSLSSRKEAVGA